MNRTARFSLCVYCGAREGRNPEYMRSARVLGRAIGENGWRLVYGAGDVGIMGAVADAATAAGAAALGVIPTHLLATEASGSCTGERIVTETMHERKKIMFMNADAVAVLPGGAGSLEEFFEVLTWAQLGLHEKPVYLVDVEGYWQPLLALIGHVIAEEFADPSLGGLLRAVPDADELVADLRRTVREAG